MEVILASKQDLWGNGSKGLDTDSEECSKAEQQRFGFAHTYEGDSSNTRVSSSEGFGVAERISSGELGCGEIQGAVWQPGICGAHGGWVGR